MKDIATEGDKYYERNRDAQNNFSTDLMQEHLRTLVGPGMKVLDVGCGTGYRLPDLKKRGAECVGVDPAPIAIQNGKKQFPDITLIESVAHTLPFPDQTFDLVFMNVVLYTIPRQFLLRTVAEMDRVLKDGGRLVVADFFPDTPHRRTDRHTEGYFNYKQRFWEMFTASNLYTTVNEIKYVFGSSVKNDSLTGGDNDCIIVDMQKNLEGNYPLRDLK